MVVVVVVGEVVVEVVDEDTTMVVVVVGIVVEVVDEEVAQPWASQQLVAGLTHELPPRGGLHACPRGLTAQVVRARAVVRRHTTWSACPQVERDAQWRTFERHAPGSCPSRTAAAAVRATQRR
jgi:hypothetical protein